MQDDTNANGTANGRFASLTPLLQPRSVAVVGASADATRIGGRPVSYMLRGEFQGRVMPVNPKRSEIQGLPAYASIDDLPEAPDASVVAVPAAQVVDTVDALGRRGGRSAIIFSSGFSEVGAQGEALQQQLLATARRHGMRLLGPNTAGAFNSTIGFFGSFMSGLERGFPLPGRIGIASQSGAYGAHLLGLARARGLGTPICAATGNECDVTLGEAIGWMVENPDIDVVMAYAEAVRDVDSFIAALEAAHAARKPVILQKVGRSALGQKAAMSHTAALAGDDRVFDAMLADYAVIRVESSAELLDVAYTATRRIYPANNSLGMLTISGGAGIIVSDLAEQLDVPMPPMPEPAQADLKAAVPFCSPINPVDCTAQVLNDLTLAGTFGERMVSDGGYASVLAFFSQAGTVPSVAPKLCAELKKVKDAHPDRLFVMSLIGEPEQNRPYEEAGFVLMEDPTDAVKVIKAMGQLGDAFARPLPRRGAVSPVTLPEVTPGEAEAKQLLAAHGIPAVPEKVLGSAEEAAAYAEQIGFPVVMKIASADIVHKSEIGGVLLNVADADSVREGFQTLLGNAERHVPDAKLDGVLVARQIVGGVECFMGIQRDPQFGPVAVFGLGGIFVEVLKDVAFRRCPFDREEARDLILSIKGAPLLQGARGRAPVDLDALSQVLANLSRFAVGAGERLDSIDINPVFAMPEGQGAFAADAVIQLNEQK
ncbi:Protein acetyltransferase [Alloalcanivorax xenomutans]|jgi:acetate---CoA ligase (ADP-forming)|uniref:acetate--CoA ligase family protein n=1 Tax=Alloalcanivorax xenomutans TaxID=1094342 RepID=UPI0006D5C493|nr:acetate--CoA ligase family protein [Alloalcanivorax xenomutans]MBA4721641.1 acetate--CoA ligase family protein [Alcanivorax sp.]PHS72116.1 MAG: CoA-binding protein [Alcanivorax sp.]CUR48373.1 Protein acetyltransferase [Alloalcanivorax xenomutans]